MRFVRDRERRITQIIDGAGRSVGYEYDGRGNLVAFVDAIGRRTRYEYREPAYPNHLTDIVDHRGVRMAAMEYQDDGRLERLCDPEGVCVRSSYDLAQQTMIHTDGLGHPTTYVYDQRGNVTRITDGLGNFTQLFYDSQRDLLIRRVDPTGATTTYTYDSWSRNIASRTDPHRAGEDADDYTTRFTYDLGGRMTSMTLPSGAVVHRDRDALGNETAMRDTSGRVMWSATYGPNGEVLTESDAFGSTTHVYGTGPEPIETTDADGAHHRMRYDAAGNLVEMVSDDGDTTRIGYDALGRELFFGIDETRSMRTGYGSGPDWTRLEDESGVGTSRTYWASGRLRSYTTPDGLTETYAYDAVGRLRTTTDPLGHTLTVTYDDAGRPISRTDSSTGATTSTELDDAGRPLASIDPYGHRTEMTYHPSGAVETLTDAREHTWTFSRTPISTTTIDPLARETTEHRTAHGLVSALEHSDGTRTEYEYALSTSIEDAADYPTLVRDELGRERHVGYSDDLEIESATDLAGNTWAFTGMGTETEVITSPEGRAITVERNDLLDPIRIEHEDGFETTMTYVEAAGPDVVTRPGGITIDFDYDAELDRETERTTSTGDWRELGYDSLGRLETVTDPTGITTHLVDSAGRSAGLRAPNGGEVRLVRDLLDRVHEVRVRPTAGAPEQVTVYHYDAVGNVARVVDPSGGETVYVYDEVNRPTQRTLPNGVVTAWAWDVRDRIESITHRAPGGAVIASRTYVRRASGEPTRVTHEDGSYVEIGYDAALRVTSETRHDAGGTVLGTITYTYDRDGNRTGRTTSAGAETYVAGAGWRLDRVERGGATVEQYGWDDAGRVTAIARDGRSLALAHSALDQLTSVTEGAATTTWSYDGEGRRVAITDGAGTRRYLVGPTLVEELESPHAVTDASGALLASYVYVGDQPLARQSSTGTVYYLEDGIGSVVAMADGAGAEVAELQYDAFGNLVAWAGSESALDPTLGGDFRFQGMWQDASTSLYHVRARTYDPRTGRFLSRDAAEGTIGVPESYHGYAFARANPYVYSDPSGFITLIETQFAQTVDRVLQGARTHGMRYFYNQAREQAMEAAADFVIGQLASMVPGGPALELFNSIADGNPFEQLIRDSICGMVGSNAATNYVYLQTPISSHSGRPGGNGFNCAESAQARPDRRGQVFGTAFPDILFSPWRPLRLDPRQQKRSYVVMEVKLSANAAHRSDTQLRAMARHAGQYSFPPVAMWTVLRATESDRLRVQREVLSARRGRPVRAQIVALLD